MKLDIDLLQRGIASDPDTIRRHHEIAQFAIDNPAFDPVDTWGEGLDRNLISDEMYEEVSKRRPTPCVPLKLRNYMINKLCDYSLGEYTTRKASPYSCICLPLELTKNFPYQLEGGKKPMFGLNRFWWEAFYYELHRSYYNGKNTGDMVFIGPSCYIECSNPFCHRNIFKHGQTIPDEYKKLRQEFFGESDQAKLDNKQVFRRLG